MPYTVLDVDSQSLLVAQHLRRVDEGTYLLPEFQRTFVWDQDRILRLWDSLYRGFPIGQLMLWRPAADIDFPMRGLGKQQAEVQAGMGVTAVIDGQQRLTALYLVLAGETKLRFDLADEKFTYTDGPNTIRLDMLRSAAGGRVPFVEAQDRQFFNIYANPAQRAEFGQAIDYLNGVLNQRQLPSQCVQKASYSEVLDVFKRLNQAGEPLNQAQLTMAEICRQWPGVFRKTYDLLHRMNTEMGYDEADDPTFIFLVWSAVHTGQHLIKHLAPEEALRSKYRKLATRDLYERSWENTSTGISKLIEVMRRNLSLTNFRFIKGYYPLAVAGHYLSTHPHPSARDMDLLRQWLMLSVVSGRYHERSQSKYAADIKATIESKPLEALFKHRSEALDLNVTAQQVLSPVQLAQADWKSAYVTLLYLVVRRLRATDWLKRDVYVGDPLPTGTWHFHHIFPHERFDGERARLRQAYEDAQEDGNEGEMRQVAEQQAALEARVVSLGNLAFLLPETNISISNRSPLDYLRQIASTKEGRASLEAQLIPNDEELWKESSFDTFCRKRCELLAAKAKELFFSPHDLMSQGKEPAALREAVLELGAEGGSITVLREGKAGEDWQYQVKTNETALYDLLSEDGRDNIGEYFSRTGYVHSFHEALGLLLDRYPEWFRLYPLKVHPEFLDAVLLEVKKRGGPTEETRWRETLK
jgi:hypothetical protein